MLVYQRVYFILLSLYRVSDIWYHIWHQRCSTTLRPIFLKDILYSYPPWTNISFSLPALLSRWFSGFTVSWHVWLLPWKVYHMMFVSVCKKGGPLPAPGPITPHLTGLISLQLPHLCSAIYRGPTTPCISLLWPCIPLRCHWHHPPSQGHGQLERVHWRTTGICTSNVPFFGWDFFGGIFCWGAI